MAKNLKITSPDEIVTSINGHTEPTDICAFLIHFQTVNFIPKGLGNLFLKLEVLMIQSSKLKTIDKYDLKPFPALLHLCIYGNELVVLESDLFEFTPNLKYIDFSRNKLIFVGENILKPLTKLEQAVFRESKCIDVEKDAPLSLIQRQIRNKCQKSDIERLHSKNIALQGELPNEKLNSDVKTKLLESCNEKINVSQKELANEKLNSEMKVKLLDSCNEKIGVSQKELANEKLNSEMKTKSLSRVTKKLMFRKRNSHINSKMKVKLLDSCEKIDFAKGTRR